MAYPLVTPRLTLRLAVDLLSSRIDQLCTFITEHDLAVPGMGTEQKHTLDRVFKHLRISNPLNPGSIGDISQLRSNHSSPQSDSLAGPNANQVGSVRPTSHQSILDWENGAEFAMLPEDVANFAEPAQLGPDRLEPTNGHGTAGSGPPDPSGLDWTWDVLQHITRHPSEPCPQNEEIPLVVPSPGSQGGGGPPPNVLSNRADGEEDETEAMLNQLSKRIGTLSIAHGQIRYYGPTSLNASFGFVDMPAPDNLTIHRTVREHGQEHLDRLQIGKLVPEELEEHLTNLYFAWQGKSLACVSGPVSLLTIVIDSTFHVVDKVMYNSARDRYREQDEDTPYYSEALQHAMWVYRLWRPD
ncbi:hypothetical protein ANO11243_010130 [Dothideomycetidae sp. 11243]|nr:hypothetical protein ANO11243_010130 [fungal sp. No.11243]